MSHTPQGRGIRVMCFYRSVYVLNDSTAHSLVYHDNKLRQIIEMVPQEEKMRAKMMQKYQPRQGLTTSQKLIEQTYMSAQFEQLQQSPFFQVIVVNLPFQ